MTDPVKRARFETIPPAPLFSSTVRLSNDLELEIIGKLSIKDCRAAELVCRAWRKTVTAQNWAKKLCALSEYHFTCAEDLKWLLKHGGTFPTITELKLGQPVVLNAYKSKQEHLASVLPNLKVLSSLTPSHFEKFLSVCPQLTSLEGQLPTAQKCQELVSRFPQIRYLDNMMKVTDEQEGARWVLLPQLRSIQFAQLNLREDSPLLTQLEKNSHLEVLDLSDSTFASDAVYARLFSPALRSLKLWQNTIVTRDIKESWAKALSAHPTLGSFKLMGNKLFFEDLQHLCSISHLKKLSIHDLHFSGFGERRDLLRELNKLAALESFNLRCDLTRAHTWLFTKDDFQRLKLPHLRSFELEFLSGVDEDHLPNILPTREDLRALLKNCPRLNFFELTLEYGDDLPDELYEAQEELAVSHPQLDFVIDQI